MTICKIKSLKNNTRMSTQELLQTIYKKIEEGAVDGFNKVTDKIIEKVFAKEGETVEDAKKRLSGDQ